MANNNWREKYRAMMTDPDYAAKAAESVDNTRKVNTNLMNRSAENYPALSVDQQSKQPLDLSRIPEMQQEQAARATMPTEGEDYSGVVDLATKLYDEERTKRGQQALQNMQQPANAFASPMATAINRAAETNKAADISKTYEAVISNPSLQQAVRLNANKALVKALEANPSMTQEEQQKLYNETIDKQLQQMGEGIDKYLRGKNELKGGGEYVLRSAIQNSIIGKAMQTAIQSASGSEGELAYQQQALADYDANKAKWWEQGLGIAGGLVLDAPLMQGIGSAANATFGRATMWGLGKAGGKALQASTVGRIATGAAVSSGTLGGYNATSALANQLMEGRFDVGEIAASAGHGFMLGALTGGMSPWLHGVSAGMGKVGKVATMASGLTAEAGIFTASELSEMDNPYDLETIAQVFGKNVAVIGGLKVSNLPKTIKEYKQWYTEGKQSNFTDADYKTMADFAKANGYAADDAFTVSADGAYSRSVADRVTGNRTLLTMTKLQGGKEQNLAIEMYNDPNVPLSLKTKIAAKMNLPAPPPVLPNGVRVEGNKAITYYTMSNGQQQVIDIKEFDRPRKARAFANEFSRTTARRNDLLQSEASVNVMMSQPMVVARLNEQAQRNGTTLADEKARMDGILQRAMDGTITQEDIAYYRSIVEDDVTTTESLKKDIKDKFGVEIDEVLNKEGNFTTAEDEALTAYGNALRTIIERGNPTTERTATAAMAGIEDYVALNDLGIGRTSAILANPEQRAAIEQQTRSHYAAWLKFFDGKMGEDALAQKLGLDLNNTSDLQTFIAEQAYFKTKAADRIAYNTAEAAKQLLERGDGGVRFLDDGRVKLKGVPFAVEVDESIAARYEAAKQGSGEPMQRIVNDALKDVIKQSETPAEPKEPIVEETPIAEEPMTEAEAVTQQMVDARLAEIDTDLQGIDADGVQRMTINGKPVAIIKGRIVADENGQVDKTKSSAEVAYMLLDENGRPILNEQGKPIIEVGVKPSNVHVEDIEQWRSVNDYKASEEQRIRDNNRITDEAMRQVDEQTEVENQTPTEPQTADDLLAMCGGDKALALDVATDELAKAMQAKGKGATPAETIEINKRIRMYQQMVDRLSATEQPESAALPEAEQTEAKAEPQVTEDMEFVYQQGLDENHDGMEPMQMADGRYKWVGLQQGELTANMGERDVELLDNLAKKLGVAVIPINVADRAVNGYYRDGNIYVNTNRGAEWTMRWVAGHEMLHDVAKKSPEAYDAYKQAVLDMWGSDYIESQVKQIIEDYAKSGKTIDREQALTELVNDFGGDLFSSRDGLKILDNILKDQSSKGNTGFIDTIKKWWDNIKEFFGVSPYANEVEKKLADAYKEAIANAEEFGRNYDFDYSIIGKRGAANLDKAEEATIRLDNLAVAREMESSGKDAKAIRMATGWERGADNKWRYEIPDEIGLDNNGMVLNVAIDKAKWERAAEKLGRTVESLKSENDNLKAEVERRRMIPSIEKMLADNENTEDSHVRELKKSALLKKLNFYKSGLKYKDSDDVEKMWADLKDSIGKVDVLKLSEVLGADNALFKAYPELADIDVRFDDKGYTSVLATVSNDGKEIWMNPHNRESQSSVFLHEIQHLIQKIEGFAKGGSSRMFDIPEEHKYANMPGNVIKSMREQAEFARKKLSQYSTLEEIKEYYNANRSWLTGSEKDAIISVMDALIYGESVEDGISSLEKDYQQAIDDLNWSLTSKDSPYSKYTRLGGEVESRNVQNRMDMAEEERRNTLLSETEDVAREDQILLFSNWDDDLAKEFSISRKIDEKYPNWLEGTTTSSGKHSTQVAGTIGTYRKVGKWIKDNLGNDIRILDASSGMGLGTEALRKDGMQIDDVEPYQSEERKKTNPATFSSYKDINGKYDFIISNAVLNVIPDDWRSNVLHDMVARLNNGGRLFINTRKAGEEKTIKDKIELDSPQEILVKRNGKIASYQRFFTPTELKEWVENELGEGYSVEIANEKNSGTKGLAAVVVRKLGEQPTDPNGGGKPTEEFSIKADKQKQLDIINRTNPAHDDYHTWIRTTDDIKTLQEAVDEVKAEDPEYDLSSYPDVTDDMINKALQSGKVTVYSSYPIKEGVFVSPSKMQAKDYAGGGKVYSKQVSISDVAWINTDEGMFAPTEYSVKGKRADESVLDYAKRMSEETGKKNLLNGGSYFSGGGLLEEGLKGIVNPTIAVEFNQKVAGVYRNNFGEHIVTADVRNVDPASLVKNIDGPVAYFHASPVCKNFSKAKQSAEELPLDKATAQSTAEFISKVRPKIVTIENVKGYRDSESMKIILDELKKQGYNYDVDVYNAADYGAYTSRERLIVRAVRDWSLPAKPMVMLADDRPSGWLEAVADIIDTLPEKKGGVAKWMDERLSTMGIDYRNIDKPLYVFGSGYSKDRIGYAFADELVPTLRTKGGDVIVMPDGRVLKATPRVLARISGMSDEYEMPKTDDLAHTIVGNGIPVQLTKAVMGSLIENVKSDLDAGNTEYSIIGKRGAANLDKRDETSIRVDNMVTAEEMEKAGKDAKTIRMATGWERGADGKWRYEVKDLYMLPFREWIGMRGKKLKDIVENAEELFAAYPELANVKIKEGKGKTYGGSYSDGTITLDTHLAKLWMKHNMNDMVEKAEIEVGKTLIHEIQHYIQEKEGFAEGGDKSMILNKDAASEIDTLISNSNKLAVQYNDMIAKGVYEGREAIKEKIISLRAEANAIKKKNIIGAEGYRSLAGEVEARNASKRMAMSEEERANTMLADTEDVPRDKQIVYENTDYSIKQPKDAEYEAKEQWRKDNAGAIASSFFADRRADKAAEVERLKKKISELKADNTEAASEDKAKVREIADEMHKYIKKNIPTENQGDMTRQQFESVLKQLETAVTKQELEKPMQMVEYIGANVARRALTRQMRDFVKNGFKTLTPKGLAKPKTADGVTSRVLGLVKTLYQAMNKNAFGSDLYKLQKQVREEKAKLEQFNADNGGKYQDVVDKVNEILAKTGVDRYEELYKYFDEKQAAGDVDGEVLGYIGRMLPLLDSIELTKAQQKQAKADSAIVTKEDLDQLRTSLEEKRDKGILSEEDKAVLDNMPLYEAMLSLHQQQLNIDGPGASSLAMQMKAKVGEIKSYSKGLDDVTDENSKTAIAYKTRIKEANNELQELFAARIVDQKAVNANVGELLDNLKEIRDTGKSKLQEWSKAKQERTTRLVKMANESFGKDAKGYWSEVDKRGKLKKDFINWANNLRLSVLMSPAMSFEYMLGVMDPRYYTNNSPIYKQFIKSSEGLIKANDNFFEGTESYNMAVNEAVERFINRNAMTNLKEYFRRGDRFATAIIPFEVKVNRNGVDEYIPKEEMMTRGQAAKIYAWSRMADGMAKLKAHGVTDNTLTKVKEFIGEDYMNFIDWVEDEFFPRLRRERYNPVYKQMYGISMAENDHYFPFLIYQKDVRTEQELEISNNDTLGGGVVGNLVERKRNNARLDFTAGSPDIFDMITDYGRKMEEWVAYAQVREDLKKVVNDKQFKQHCDELGTHYYKYFLEAAQVASRLSRDMAMTQHTQSGWAKAQKTIASAAISLRVSTALKQLLSAPAFMVYSLDPAFHHELIKTVQPIDVESAIKGLWKLAEGDMSEAKKLLLSENWVGHYNWCVENLPSFRERVTLGGAGNPILEEKGFFKFADDIQSVGMLPNRLVDAFTCSVGAKAIYEYAYKKYKKNYSEKTAHNMAVTDAEIAFNSSQQSSNPVFLAPMQVSKQFLLRGMMNYKNSPIGYYRNAMKASIDMYRATKAIFGQPKFTINGEVYGFENDGKNPFAMAAESGARASMFWLFLNLIWNFGTVGVAGLSYTMLNGSKSGDGNALYTDEEIKKALGDDMRVAVFNAATQGIPWVSGFASAAQTGQDYTPSILFSEMNNYVEQINKDGFMSMATAQIFTDLLLKNAAGVDPEVWGQIYRGAQGIMEDRPMRIEDFMNLIASPRSAISGVTKQRVGEYDRLRDYVNDRIESNRQLGVDERMTFSKKLTGMRELSKKSLGIYVDEYLADKIPGYREFTNKPTEMEKEEEVANSNTLNAASSLFETIKRKEEEKEEKKDEIKDRSTKRKVKVLTKVANVIHKLCEVNDFETAERVANEMERRVKRGYNPDGETIEERLKNVDVWDSTGTTEQRSADGFSTAFDRARKGGFDSYLRRGKD